MKEIINAESTDKKITDVSFKEYERIESGLSAEIKAAEEKGRGPHENDYCYLERIRDMSKQKWKKLSKLESPTDYFNKTGCVPFGYDLCKTKLESASGMSFPSKTTLIKRDSKEDRESEVHKEISELKRKSKEHLEYLEKQLENIDKAKY